MTSESTESIWKPTKKQLEFLKAGSIFEVAYLGGAGSGKSSVLLIDACRQMNYPDAKAVVFRRTTRELRQLLDYSQQIYPRLGAKWNEHKSKWQFPSVVKSFLVTWKQQQTNISMMVKNILLVSSLMR